MEAFALAINPEMRYQVMTLTVTPGGKALRLRVELRYLNYAERWFLSIFDSASGASYVRYVPVVASYEYLNDILEPFRALGLGSIYCYPVVSDPSTPDPALDNWDEFELVWGDS